MNVPYGSLNYGRREGRWRYNDVPLVQLLYLWWAFSSKLCAWASEGWKMASSHPALCTGNIINESRHMNKQQRNQLSDLQRHSLRDRGKWLGHALLLDSASFHVSYLDSWSSSLSAPALSRCPCNGASNTLALFLLPALTLKCWKRRWTKVPLQLCTDYREENYFVNTKARVWESFHQN